MKGKGEDWVNNGLPWDTILVSNMADGLELEISSPQMTGVALPF